MLACTDDDYSDDEVHRGKFVAPRPHIQVELFRIGRRIQKLLMEEPGRQLNLCKLREVYEGHYGQALDKCGYSKLIGLVHALPEPLATRNVRPNGMQLLLIKPMVPSCQAFQVGNCKRSADDCQFVHECSECGFPSHSAQDCATQLPSINMDRYTHCCLRSKCVGDSHNPDFPEPVAHEEALEELSVKPARYSVAEVLRFEHACTSSPEFLDPNLACLAIRRSPSPKKIVPTPSAHDPHGKLKCDYYIEFLVNVHRRHPDANSWPMTRDDFSFEWEGFLSANRKRRSDLVTIIDFSATASIRYLASELFVITVKDINDPQQLFWHRDRVLGLVEHSLPNVPPSSRPWRQSCSQWAEGPSLPCQNTVVSPDAIWGAANQQLIAAQQSSTRWHAPSATQAPFASGPTAPPTALKTQAAPAYRPSVVASRAAVPTPILPPPSMSPRLSPLASEFTIPPNKSLSPNATPFVAPIASKVTHTAPVNLPTDMMPSEVLVTPQPYQPRKQFGALPVKPPLTTAIKPAALGPKTALAPTAASTSPALQPKAAPFNPSTAASNASAILAPVPVVAFASSVDPACVLRDLNSLKLVDGDGPNLTWNEARVAELATLEVRPHHERTSSEGIVRPAIVDFDKNSFLGEMLYQAVLGVAPASIAECDMFLAECVRLRKANVDAVIAGMRALWLVSHAAGGVAQVFAEVKPGATANATTPIAPEGLSIPNVAAAPPVPIKSTCPLPPTTLAEFLALCDLSALAHKFAEEDIGFDLLRDLSDADLFEIGILDASLRDRFRQGIKRLLV